MSGRGISKKERLPEAQARFLKGESIKQISAKLKVSETTLYKWRRDNNWDELKESQDTTDIVSAQKIKAAAAFLAEEMAKAQENKDVPTLNKLMDSLAKASRGLGVFDKERDPLGEVVRVVTLFREYLKEKRLTKEMEIFGEILEGFTQWSLEKFGK